MREKEKKTKGKINGFIMVGVFQSGELCGVAWRASVR